MEYETSEAVPAEWNVGDLILNRYEVLRKFEGGGMGIVYRIYHREWNMDLAVKTPRAEFFQNDSQKKDFEREAETWVNLGLHPHIVSCYYVRRLGGIPCLFAEYMEGGSLADWISDGRLYAGDSNTRLLRVLDIAIQIATALKSVHEKGVHQDVKPANVMMTRGGTAKLTDFGLARARSFLEQTKTTESSAAGATVWFEGAGMLTPEYASPEQFKGELLSSCSDSWSWALTVLEMMQKGRVWSDGRFGYAALCDYYQEAVDIDPIAKALKLHLDDKTRHQPRLLTTTIEELTALYSRISRQPYPRTRQPDHALKLQADDLNNRGVAFMELGKFAEAESMFWKAIELDNVHPYAHYNLAVSNWRGHLEHLCCDLEVIDKLLAIRNPGNALAIKPLIEKLAEERGFPEPNLGHTAFDRRILTSGLETLPQLAQNKLFTGPPLASMSFDSTSDDDHPPKLIGLDFDGLLQRWDLDGARLTSVQLNGYNPKIGEKSTFTAGICVQECNWFVAAEKVTSGIDKDAPSVIWISVHDIHSGLSISRMLAHPTRSGPRCSFWDKSGLACFRIIEQMLLITAGVNDSTLKIWKLPELTLICEVPIGEISKAESHWMESSSLRENIQLHNFQTAPNRVYEVRSVLERDQFWSRSDYKHKIILSHVSTCGDLVPGAASSSGATSCQNQTKPLLVLTSNGRPLYNSPDMSSFWQVSEDHAEPSIWESTSPLDKKYYLRRWDSTGKYSRSIKWSTYCGFGCSVAFSADAQYLVVTGSGNLARNGDSYDGYLHLVDAIDGRCICSLIGPEFDRPVVALSVYRRQIILAVAHDAEISVCRFRQTSRQTFLAIARPNSTDSLISDEKQLKATIQELKCVIERGAYLEALQAFQRNFSRKIETCDDAVQRLEMKIVSQLKPIKLRELLFERNLGLPKEDHDGLRHTQAFTNNHGTHVLVYEEGRNGHYYTSVLSTVTGSRMWHDWQWQLDPSGPPLYHAAGEGLSGYYLGYKENRLIRISENTSDDQFGKKLIDQAMAFSASCILGRDHEFSFGIWSLPGLVRKLSTVINWEIDFVQGILVEARSEEIGAWVESGAVSQDGKWTVLAIRIEKPFNGLWFSQFSAESVRVGFLFESPGNLQGSSQLFLAGADRFLLCLTANELIVWCIENGSIAERVPFSDSALSLEAKCFPFVFVGFSNGSVGFYDLSHKQSPSFIQTLAGRIDTIVITDDYLRLVLNSRLVYHILWEYLNESLTT